jgi:hypothetical protein
VFRRVLQWLRDPRVLISMLTGTSVVVFAGGARLVFASWLVAAITGLAVVLIGLLGMLLWVLYSQDRERRIQRGTEEREFVEQEHERGRARSALESLEERFRRAVDEIKRSQRGPKGIYQNPWYLVIGEPGSGKSALLAASGLELPAKFEGFVGRGPTESCDWWITNEAVLLDTAGRYAETLDPKGRREWRKLLRLLRKTRPKGALNGIILALPTTTLLGKSDSNLVEMARELRRRLNEITDLLGVDAPIYVAISKADRIDGFLETVRALPPQRLQEALGWTNPERRIAHVAEHVEEGLDGLVERLDLFLPELVLREADPLARAKVFLFPQAVAEVARAATVFLGQLFQRAISEETPFLRGVYLTSALQEGRTISPLLESLGHVWAHTEPAHDARPAALFLRGLFGELIVDPEEAGLARRTGRLGPLGRRIVLGSAAALALFALGTQTASFVLNLRAIGRLADQTEGLLAATPSIAMLAELAARIDAEAASAGLFFHRAGLFGPTRRALDRTRRTFAWSFEREQEQPTKDKLLATVRKFDPNSSFAALADLALDIAWLDGGSAGDPPDLARYTPLRANEVDQRLFQQAYAAFGRGLPDVERKRRVERERDSLGRASGALLSIEQLEAWAASNTQPVRYTDLGIALDASVEIPEVPGAYTRQTWEALVRGLIQGVERTGGATQEAVDAFQRDYVERYDDYWRRLLVGAPTAPTADGNVKESPYLALLDRVHVNATADLRRPQGPPPWLEDLEAVRRSEPKEGEEKGAPWTRYQQMLAKADEEVKAVQVVPADALDLAERVIGGKAPSALSEGLALVREIVPVRRDVHAAAKLREILAMPFANGYSAVVEAAMAELDTRWYDFASAYPAGETDAGLLKLCGPSGLEKFQQTNLAPFRELGELDPLLGNRSLPLGSQFRDWLESAEALCGGITEIDAVPVNLAGIPSRVAGAQGLYVSRRELRVECGSDEHVYVYKEGGGSYGFTWSPACQEVSLRVWVLGTGPGERQLSALEHRGKLAFPRFLRSGRSTDDPGRERFRWEFKDAQTGARIVVEYRLSAGGELARLGLRELPRSLKD